VEAGAATVRAEDRGDRRRNAVAGLFQHGVDDVAVVYLDLRQVDC
jgi:hypothetical protein